MYIEYLLTGATGFLGNTIAWKLHEKGCRCKALVRSGDAFSNTLLPDTELYNGDLPDYDSLEDFFSGSSEESCTHVGAFYKVRVLCHKRTVILMELRFFFFCYAVIDESMRKQLNTIHGNIMLTSTR